MTSVDRSLRTAIAVIAFGALVAIGGMAMAGSLGGPLELQDEGSFFVNGQLAASTHPGTAVGGISQPGTITVNQMYVQYRIPQTVRGPAIVMVHGSGHTGRDVVPILQQAGFEVLELEKFRRTFLLHGVARVA